MGGAGRVRPCSVCGRTLENTRYSNKSAICRCCRRKWEREHPDRYWNRNRKCWLLKKEYCLIYHSIIKHDTILQALAR